MLDRVHPPICSTNDLIQNREGCLERSELDKSLDRFCIDFAGLDYLLTTSTKTRKVEI